MAEPVRHRPAPIGKMLFEAGVCTREQVEKALEIQRRDGGKTFEILIRLGYLEKDALHSVLSRQQGIASIDLGRFKVSPDLLGLIPKDLALKELVLPIDKLGKLLTVAMACPADVETIAQIEQLTGLSVKAMLARYDDIAAAVEKYYPRGDSQHDALPVFEMPGARAHAAQPAAGLKLTEDIRQLAMPAPLPGVGAKVLELARAANPDLKGLMQAAAADPVLSGWLLAVANSPAYGMPAQVESLGLALALLGAEGVAAAVETLQADSPPPKAQLAQWGAASQKAALAAAVLGKKCGKVDRSAAYTAGLLRRLGVYALGTLSADAANIPVDLAEEQRCEQERSRFGITHLEAGAILASRWRYPESLLRAYDMAAGSSGSTPLAAVAILGAALAEQGSSVDTLAPLAPQLSTLGIDATTAIAETKKVVQE